MGNWKPRFIRHEECPVCNGRDIPEIGLSETYFIRPFDREITIRLACCSDCGFLFQIEPPDEESLARYYERSFQYRHIEPDIVEEHVHAQQAAFMAGDGELIGKTVLEIGSSTGRFLSHLKVLHGCETWFDELNAEAKVALVQAQGHEDSSAANAPESFDYIVMRHVLEHIVDSVGYLKALRPRLGETGTLFIEVPDFSFLDDRTDTLLFEHVNYFSVATLARALDNAGYVAMGLMQSITGSFATCSDRVLRVRARLKPPSQATGTGEAMCRHIERKVRRQHENLLSIVEEMGPDTRIGFYSASWWTERALLNTDIDRKRIVGIFDKDKKKIGTTYHGLEVHAPQRVNELAPDVMFVLTSFEPQIKRDLRAMNFTGRVVGWSDLERERESDGDG